ncbi:DUF1653 domain-containing protein [Paraburkholderia sediminicola]
MTEDQAREVATHQHYKGGLYYELFDIRHTERDEALTVYLHLWPHERGGWGRPVARFTGALEDGTRRFTPMGE